MLSVHDGNEVAIATREAQRGDDLDTLEASVLSRFRAEAEAERSGRTAAMRLQTQAIRRIVEALRPERQAGIGVMTQEPDGLLGSVRRRRARHQDWIRHGEPSFARYLAQVGVLGWAIVVPTLLGVFLGRWIDFRLGTGIFWTGPLLLLGLGIGCWSAWRWMHAQ